MVFAAGYPAWKKLAGTQSATNAMPAAENDGFISIEDFKTTLENNPDSIQLIDVRDKDEYDAGHFKTAVHLPTNDLEKNVKTLSDKKPIIFVCNSGAKSGEAFYMLQDLRPDLKKVYFLDATVKYTEDGNYTIKKTE